MTEESNREGLLARWAPQAIGWIIAALLGFTLMQTRVAILERSFEYHDQRISALENSHKTTEIVIHQINLTLAKIETLLDEINNSRNKK